MRSIYVVDDDQPVRTALQSLLSVLPNVMVFVYRSGDDFIAQAQTLDRGCVLLDYDMPGRSGLDVLRELGGINRGAAALPRKFGTIILTGKGATSVAVQAWKLGALDFLEKPCDPAVLLEVVENTFAIIEQDHKSVSLKERAQSAVATLTTRELDVLTGLVEGRPNKVIAQDLNLSSRTVEIHRANLMIKLNARSLAEALRVAFSAGLAPLN